MAIFKCKQAVVGDGDAVSVAAQISQDLLWSPEGRLGIDPPLASPQTDEQALESEWLGQVGAGAVKGKFVVLKSARQGFQKESAEESREHVYWQEEALTRTKPAPISC